MAKGMTQVKFTIESGCVAKFKVRCADEGVSMTSAVRQFMGGCTPAGISAIKVHTRPLRRIAVVSMIHLLKDILCNEERYRDAIPEQFGQRIDTADTACEYLLEAIESLSEAFP